MTKVYSVRSNCIRAARKELGDTEARNGKHFTVTEVEGGFSYALAKDGFLPVQPEPVVEVLPPEPAVRLAAVNGAPVAPEAEIVAPEAPVAAPARAAGGKIGMILEKAKTEGITMRQVRELTGWTKTGGFFGAVKRHGLTLSKEKVRGETVYRAA